jgi:hypothetical protein
MTKTRPKHKLGVLRQNINNLKHSGTKLATLQFLALVYVRTFWNLSVVHSPVGKDQKLSVFFSLLLSFPNWKLVPAQCGQYKNKTGTVELSYWLYTVVLSYIWTLFYVLCHRHGFQQTDPKFEHRRDMQINSLVYKIFTMGPFMCKVQYIFFFLN